MATSQPSMPHDLPHPELSQRSQPAPAEPEPAEPEPVVAAVPAPPPEPTVTPGMVRVELVGDVSRVWLQGPNGNTPLPAEVPPGTYSIEAFFDDTPTTVGQITLRAGAIRTVRCGQDMRVCR